MAGSPLWALQSAVYAALIADATLRTLLGASEALPRIFDYVPPDQTYPYVVVGGFRDVKDDTFGRVKKRCLFTVACWSSYQGAKEVEEVGNRVAALLDGAALSITGWTLTKILHEATSALNIDGVIRQGVAEFSAIVTQA